MWKKTEGVTLVELTVAIVILGILAGVAVPACAGYIAKANRAADLAALESIKAAAIAVLAETAEEVTVLKVGKDYIVVNNHIDLPTEEYNPYYKNFALFSDGATGVDFKTKVGGKSATMATWTKDGGWIFS